MTHNRLTVIQERGSYIENQHRISVAAYTTKGNVVLDLDQAMVTTFRSSAKPFQLLGCLDLLSSQQCAALTEEQLALGTASHSGESKHVAGVRDILSHFELPEEQLLCGTHWPVHPESAYAVARSGNEATAIHNNCSGKHAFMLAARKFGSESNDSDYRKLEHEIQQSIFKRITEACGEAAIDTVIDGCGVPCFVMSLSAMARSWAFLAGKMARNDGMLARIGWAMHKYSYLISGTNRLDNALVQSANKPMVAKVGAEGVHCFAIPHLGLGIAIKVHSGTSNPRAPAAIAVLDKLAPGLLDANGMQHWLQIRNWAGELVGRRFAKWGD